MTTLPTDTPRSVTNSIHRTDFNKPPAPLRDDVGLATSYAKKSCYRCSQFSHDVVITKHPIYRYMCKGCKAHIFPPKPVSIIKE